MATKKPDAAAVPAANPPGPPPVQAQAAKAKPPRVKEAKVKEWLDRIPPGQRPTEAKAKKALDAIQVTKGVPVAQVLAARGLKMG